MFIVIKAQRKPMVLLPSSFLANYKYVVLIFSLKIAPDVRLFVVCLQYVILETWSIGRYRISCLFVFYQ